MRQNYKLQRFNRVVIALAILILLTGGIFAAVKFLTPASDPVEAAEREYVASSNYHYYSGTYYDIPNTYCYIYVSCDDLGVSSITGPDLLRYSNSYQNSDPIPVSSIHDSIYWYPTSLNLTINLIGYSWVNTVTSFSAKWAISYFDRGTSLETALSDAKRNLNNSRMSATITYTRSDNNFTTSSKLTDVELYGNFRTDHNKYPYVVLYIDFEKLASSVQRDSYTLSFDSNGGNTISNTITTYYNSTIGSSLPTPQRDSYIFNGWYIGNTYITSGTTWSWTSDQIAQARWTFDGYTLAYSVDNDIGGSIVGASTQYAKNSSVTVTASPAEGYVFDHWVLNGTSATANPLTFTITQNSTLVAYFREIPNVTVTISGDIQCDIQKTVDSDAFIVVTPPTSNYVSSITIDGKVFPIQYYHANVYGAGEAHLISYTVRDTSNTFSIYFENLFGSSTLEISLVNVKPTYQNPPLGGASVEGVATQATVGGETRVTGVDTASANATVHLSAISYAGYVFTGWTASDGTDLSAYGSSADIPYSLIEGKIITANFTSTSNSSANGTTDNQDGTPEII